MMKWIKNKYKENLDYQLLWNKDSPKLREKVKRDTASWIVLQLLWKLGVATLALAVATALFNLGILLYILVPILVIGGTYFLIKRILKNVDK